MNKEISINVTNELKKYISEIQTSLINSGFTDGDDNSQLVVLWNVASPFNCALRLFVLANEEDMIVIQNTVIEEIFKSTGISLAVNFIDGCVTWFDVALMPTESVEDVVDYFIQTFDTVRENDIREAWNNTSQKIKYDDLDDKTMDWMRQNLIDAGNIAKNRFERKNKSKWTWQSSIIPHLELEEHFLWLAELASRSAPDDPKAQHWMLS